MKTSGKSHVFDMDNLNTDYIISGRYLGKYPTLQEALPHLFEELRPGFAEKIAPGDIIVSGWNFGAGSTREHAPILLKMSGIGAILAKSFSRSFFRNGINVGLLLVEAQWSDISDGDMLSIDTERGIVEIPGKERSFSMKKLSGIIRGIHDSGGLVPFFNEHREMFSV
jgi:3-isopropylmalate/(R)-2-methylmalate dehydratase small subunit